MSRLITCADCGCDREHRARGLCKRCYDRQWKGYNMRIRVADRIEDLEFLAAQGVGLDEAVERIAGEGGRPVTTGALAKWCRVHGVEHLLDRLRANEERAELDGCGARAGRLVFGRAS